MPSLRGKVALITGASAGIGRATAELFAREGILLALAARRVAKLEEVAREVKDKYGATPLVLPTDLRREEDIKSMVQKTYDHFGRLDILVNNAGILKMESILTESETEMRDIFETNFWSVVRAVRAAARIMGQQGDGHVINVASGVSRRGLPFMSVYSASKFALAGLTESLRLELTSYKIAWTTIYPGGVETDMPRNIDRARLPANYPDHTRSRITPERVARAILVAARYRPVELYVPWWLCFGAYISVIAPTFADFLIKKAQRIK